MCMAKLALVVVVVVVVVADPALLRPAPTLPWNQSQESFSLLLASRSSLSYTLVLNHRSSIN